MLNASVENGTETLGTKAGIYKEFKQHFQLDEPKLRKIADVLRSAATRLDDTCVATFYAELENDSYFETASIDELLQYENPQGKAIIRLIVGLYRAADRDRTSKSSVVSVVFATQEEFKTRFAISRQDRDWCLLLADELETQIKRTHVHRNSSILDHRRIDLIVMGGLALLVGALGAVFLSKGKAPQLGSVDEKLDYLVARRQADGMSPAAAMYGLAMLSAVLVMEWRPIRRIISLFRKSTFYWGDAKVRHDRFLETATRWKWGGIIAFVVSVAAGLLVWWLQARAAK